jgi:tRNA-uridine 2-sulfurtransferase
MRKVVIGMSGGVDSSVSALLLKEQGYQVTALFMKNWEEQDADGACHSAQDYADVVKVCETLDIPYYAVNFVNEYREHVFSQFLSELRLGHTPNPDILCNREIKFKVFLEKALELGADYLATGHYCQIEDGKLLKGKDCGKDQSYFLYTLNHKILEKVLFPIGHLEKAEVRRIAKERGLATSEKKDSTGICFIGKRDFKSFVASYLGYQEGDFETLCGKKVGRHDGIAFYTIGQRKGLGIGGQGEAWFVVGKEPLRNVVFVEQGEHNSALYKDHLLATELSWVSLSPPLLPFACKAKVRYRQSDQPCIIESITQGRAHVRFLTPQRAITPRQSIVFYDQEICLGGGIIV